jgi:hypothetical protein
VKRTAESAAGGKGPSSFLSTTMLPAQITTMTSNAASTPRPARRGGGVAREASRSLMEAERIPRPTHDGP